MGETARRFSVTFWRERIARARMMCPLLLFFFSGYFFPVPPA